MADKTERRFQPPPSDDLLGHATRFDAHFGRYVRDGLGIFLIAAGLISLLGLMHATGGMALTPWSSFLGMWFGWGGYLLMVGIVAAGFRVLRRNAGGRIHWG